MVRMSIRNSCLGSATDGVFAMPTFCFLLC